MPTSYEQMKVKWKCVVVNQRQQISADKSEQTSTSLEIHSGDFRSWGFRCSVVKVSCLKLMILNECNSHTKT